MAKLIVHLTSPLGGEGPVGNSSSPPNLPTRWGGTGPLGGEGAVDDSSQRWVWAQRAELVAGVA